MPSQKPPLPGLKGPAKGPAAHAWILGLGGVVAILLLLFVLVS